MGHAIELSESMDEGDGTSGTSADVPERRSWTDVDVIFIGKNIEKKAIGTYTECRIERK